MRLGLWLVAALGLFGCAAADDGSAAGDDDFMDMDTPPGNCSAGTTGMPCPDPASTGAPEGGACIDSSDCAGGNHCIAPFVDGEVGDFVCTSQCIALMDESAWCLDSAACCDGAVCNPRGLCVEGALDDSGSGSDSGSGTADGSGTGTSSGTTGGSDGSSSGTGASTGTTGGMGA